MSLGFPLRRAAALGVVLCLGACATAPVQSSDTGGLTPDEVALREQSASFVAQNVFEGAVVNAAPVFRRRSNCGLAWKRSAIASKAFW